MRHAYLLKLLQPVLELPGGWEVSTPHLVSSTPLAALVYLSLGSDVTQQIAKMSENTKFSLVNTWVFKAQNTPKPVFGRGSTLDHAGGAYDTPQTPCWLGRGTPLAIPIPRSRRL